MNFEETSGDMSAEQAQQYAGGEMSADQGFAPTASSSPFSRLFDGRASGPSVSKLEMDYELEKDQAIFGRGLIRTATGDGVPPIAEILGGGFMWLIRAQRGGGGGGIDGMAGALEQAPDDE